MKYEFTFSAGALLRGRVRLSLARKGYQFDEHKSLLESVFVVHDLTPRDAASLDAWVAEMAE